LNVHVMSTLTQLLVVVSVLVVEDLSINVILLCIMNCFPHLLYADLMD